MPQNEAAAVDQISGGTFSRLLFSDVEDEDSTVVGLHHHRNQPDTTIAGGCASRFTFPADKKPPKMLCFGAIAQQDSTTDDNNNSSSPSSTTTSSNSNMKKNKGCDYYQPVVLPTTATPPVRTTGRNHKKMKAENTPPASHAKVKKEKLGERIAALQQMVSPYGKTDTASVLHEAMGYIKFLQEQVQVLCSPYLQRQDAVDKNVVRERKKDLRSRGLCLVPVECTLHVAESNGADLWSPAMVNRHATSSSSALR